LFWICTFFLFLLLCVTKRERKLPKKEKNQRNQIEFARILVRKFSGTRPQKFASKIQQFYAKFKQLRCTMRFLRIQAFGLYQPSDDIKNNV